MGVVKYTGPVASFHCPTSAEIRSLKVHFSPKQEGSGDPSPENVREIVGWDGVKAYDWTSANASTSSVPSEYKKVEYLESTGTQYIYTNVPGRYGIECCAKVSWTSGGDTTIFGARKAVSDRIMLIHQYPSNRWTLGYGASYTGLSQIDFDTIYDVESKACPGEQYLKINGTTVYTGTDSTEYSNDFNMSLFACTNGSSSNINLKSSARIYSLSAKLDGVDVLNVVPCLRKSDNKPGMYDTVSQTFYINAGTGEFLYGPEVSGYTEDYEFGVLGKNKFNKDVVTDYHRINGNGEITAQSGMSISDYIPVVPNQQYTITTTGDISGNKRHAYYDENKQYLRVLSGNPTTITIPEDAHYIRLTLYDDALDTTQLELGSSATTYEPYNPNKTVYGGWVDLVSGEVQQEWTEPLTLGEPYYYGGNVCFGYTYPSKYTPYSDNLPSNRVLSALNKSKFSINTKNTFIFGYDDTFEKTDGNGNLNPEWTDWYNSLETKPTISLQLYEPITYSLAPIQLQTFLSQNNVWSNADYVEVEYDLHETQTILARKQFIMANQPHIVKPAAAPLQNFVTDIAAPLKSCKIEFKPVQEGSGDPSPDNVRAISGWNGLTAYHCKENLIPANLNWLPQKMKTTNGIITTSVYNCFWFPVPKGTIYFHKRNSSVGIAYMAFIDKEPEINDVVYGNITLSSYTNYTFDNSEGHPYAIICGPTGTRTETASEYCLQNEICVTAAHFNSLVEYPEPYIGTTFPITFPSITNLLNSTTITTNKTLSAAGEEIGESGMSVTDFIKVAEGEQYTLTFTSKEGARTRRIYGYDSSKEPVQSLAAASWVSVDSIGTLTTTIPSGVEYIRVCYKTADEDVFLEGPESSTVYGGYVDLISGEVVAEYEMLSDTWGNWGVVTDQGDGTELRYKRFKNPVYGDSKGNNISYCNVAKYWYTNNNGTIHFYIPSTSYNCRIYLPSGTDTNLQIQAVGKLVTPIHYLLTPTQLKTLRGTNNIWSNANGPIEVSYWTY